MAAHQRLSIHSHKLACFLGAVCTALLQWTAFYTPSVNAATATVVRVAINGLSTPGCGDTWATACGLVYALQNAPEDSQIWVKTGIYPVPAPNSPFNIRSGLGLYGGFSGNETTLEARNWRKSPTILSGDVNQDDGTAGGQQSDNSFHVVLLNRSSTSTHLDGFTIQAGNATGADTNAQGGAIRIYHGSPVLENLTFQHNSASRGGAIYCAGNSAPTLLDIAFESNHAGEGGAIYIEKSCSLLLEGSAFRINQANQGGGISNYGRLTANNLSMSGNTAKVQGGAIYNGRYYVVLTNSILWGNHRDQVSNQLANSGQYISASNNLIEGGYNQSGGSNLNVDPLFVENPSYGSDQLWGTSDDTPGNLELRYTSPAIDRGFNLFLNTHNLLTRDLNHWPRFIDHPRADTPAGQIVDLGAYEAGIIHVLKDNAMGSGDGSSWYDAYPELRTALAEEGHAGNEVWVAAGIYQPDPGRASSFHLATDLAIYGGFAGRETTRDQRDWQNYAAILSGNLGDKNDLGDNAYHVVSASTTGSSAILDGFTIQEGNASADQGPEGLGGGLYLEQASPTLAHLIIRMNQARSGGGLYASNSSYHLIDSMLTQNQAEYGGGIFQAGSGSPHLANLIFTGNRASEYGGAMFNGGSTAPDLSNAVFAGNQSRVSGGIFNTAESQPFLRNISLVGNQGGAVYTFASSQEIHINLVNVILWDNGYNPIMTFGGSLHFNRGILQYNCPALVECNYILSTDPLFNRLPSAGADKQWGTEDDDYGDLRLTPSSPAIDAGDNNLVLRNEITTDLAGNPRFTDVPASVDTGLGEPPLVDMGAYEAKYANTSVSIDHIDPEPSMVGQAALVYFKVTSDGTPSGMVTIQSKDASCSAPANEGVCSIVFPHSGDTSLTAYFAGDVEFDASFSDSFTHHVDPAPTQVLLSLAGSEAVAGQPVHASFTVTSLIPDAGQPVGTVHVGVPPDGCTAPIDEKGEGSCDLIFTTPGSYAIIAQYQDGQDYQPAQSSAVNYLIRPAATTTRILQLEQEPSVVGEPVTVVFEVTADIGVPEAVTTISDSSAMCSAPATDGQCMLNFTRAGTTSLTAKYEDGVLLQSSESLPVQHTVNPASTALNLTLSTLETVETGQLIRAAFDLSVLAPGSGSPTGIVEISDGETTCRVEASAKSCDLWLKGIGDHHLTARYLGSADFLPSSSDPETYSLGVQIFMPFITK